jgi:hypothetical protein
MIWLLARPLPLSYRELDRQHAERLRKKDNLLKGEGEGVGEEPNYRIARQLGPL